jgi:CubicO group peptidase (beta-lactamase class C family)
MENTRVAHLEDQIDRLVKPLVDQNLLSGSVLIAKKDAVLLAKGYGFASREHCVSNTPDTRFGLASVSKSITALVIFKLIDMGLIELTDTLNK